VAVSANQAPTANAGANQNLGLASNLTVILSGTGEDTDGNIASYAWTCYSYTPAAGVLTPYNTAQVTAMLNNAATNEATVALRKAGTYVFRLTVTDCDGATGTSNVTVTVEPMTRNITVPAITNPVTNPLEFGAVSALSGWDSFPHTDVTYTLTLSQDGTTITTISSNDATSISASGQSNGVYMITQTFYYKGNPIPNGSRSAGVVIGGNTFGGIIVDEATFIEGSFGPLTLSLSKSEL
jgi:hypothetical protein